MTVKLSGAEWNAFMADKAEWPDGAWYEDETFAVDGHEWPDGWDGKTLNPAATVEVSGGDFYPADSQGFSARTFFGFEDKVATWLKRRTVEVIVIEVEKPRLRQVLSTFGRIEGVKIISGSPA